MNLKHIAALALRWIAIAAAAVVIVVFLSGCAETISCACGPDLPEFPRPSPSEINTTTAADSNGNKMIAGVSVEERNSQ